LSFLSFILSVTHLSLSEGYRPEQSGFFAVEFIFQYHQPEKNTGWIALRRFVA
jgi:hypothetical protein